MTALLIALATALAPGNPVMLVSARDLHAARDRWLLAVLALGSVWLAFHGALWLSLIGLWYLLTWRDESQRSSLLVWCGIGASWFLLRSLPELAWTYLPWAWLALAGVQVAFAVVMVFKATFPPDNRKRLGWRTKGILGSPVITAIALVVTLPFSPWWLWPLFAVGFYVTFSYTAFLGIVVVALMLNPVVGLWLGAGFVVLLFTLWVSKRNSQDVVGKATFSTQRLFEATPRGDSVDGWWGRLVCDQLLISEWWTNGRCWLGYGPASASKAIQVWNSKQGQELPTGDAHNDVLQLLYEHGLVGLAAALVFCWPIVWNLKLHDPYSAAWVVCVAISMVHWPTRHTALGMLFLAISARLA